jgi:hypothetical protein
MMEYWLNIPYLIRLPKLSTYLGKIGGDTCQQLIGWKKWNKKEWKYKYISLSTL